MVRRAREAALEKWCMRGVSKAIAMPGPTCALRQAVQKTMSSKRARRSQIGMLRAAGSMMALQARKGKRRCRSRRPRGSQPQPGAQEKRPP